MAHQYKEDWGRDRRSLKLCLTLNIVYFVVELLGGIWTNSLALISDALKKLMPVPIFVHYSNNC